MPAAAVIPAPIVYIKVAAVKKLVVGFRTALRSKLAVRRGWTNASYLRIVNLARKGWELASDHLL